MKTEWDYSSLADAYLKRPPYAEAALDKIFAAAGLKAGDRICDIGAGVAHLTIPMAQRGCHIVAVEPNNAMRANGIRRTAIYPDVSWVEAGGEATGQVGGAFDFVSFGSSFNVMDRQKALAETHRLLKSGRCFACLWNHRDLNDPVQKRIEEIIASHIPGYGYGTRREDQTEEIKRSGLFEAPLYIEASYLFPQPVEESVEAWESHATLDREAIKHGVDTKLVTGEIKKYLLSLKREVLNVPYTTRAWVARKRD